MKETDLIRMKIRSYPNEMPKDNASSNLDRYS